MKVELNVFMSYGSQLSFEITVCLYIHTRYWERIDRIRIV